MLILTIMIINRQCETLIEEYLSFFPCVVLVGARQTGKSTLLRKYSEGGTRQFFDLELRADFDQIDQDSDLFLQLQQGPIAIDEAQLMPKLFSALRVAIDRHRDSYGRYLLSGSSSPSLLENISESLAGRVGIIEIGPLSYREICLGSESRAGDVGPALPNSKGAVADLLAQEELSIQVLANNMNAHSSDVCQQSGVQDHAEQHLVLSNQYWLNGGYPEPWIRQAGRFPAVWREQYFKTYIERDLARLFPAINGIRFRRFIELLANSSGDILNYAAMAGVLDVSQPTIKDYVRIATGTFLWRLLPPFLPNTTKRLIKSPRGYFRDSGLLHHLLQVGSEKQLMTHVKSGASWEGLVIQNILLSLDMVGVSYQAYFYRTASGAEVDLIIESNLGLLPIEIKHTQTIRSKHLRTLKAFVSEFNCPLGLVICRDSRVRQLTENVFSIPFHWL